jgi:hypothetical protein
MPAKAKFEKIDPNEDLLQNNDDFSLMLGGPLYELYLRMRLSTPRLGLVRRRVIIISLMCWLPLLVLSLVTGHAFGSVNLPFLRDVEVHTRFLLTLPMLIVAEFIVHERIILVVRHFLERDLIAVENRQRFAQIMSSTTRLRNSVFLEVVLLVLCFTVGHWVWNERIALKTATWYETNYAWELHLTAAGYWYEFVSLAIFRFILFRWYYRLFLWYYFLWRVRGLPLQLNLYHPDRAGGLGFLAGSMFAFAPVLLAHTVFLSGVIYDRILHAGATLLAFKMEIIGSLLGLLLLVLIPLTFFVVHLERAQRVAGGEFGVLSSHYVNDFRHKWILHRSSSAEPILGTPDIQALADLGHSFEVISKIGIVPFSKDAVIRLGVILILPLLPLTLTMVPLKQIVDWILKLTL